MKKLLYILVAMLTIGSVVSCDESDDLSTNQYADGVALNAFGPSPVARGGQIRFVGSNLNQITSVVFPDGGSGIEVTDIERVSDKQINVTVPKDDVIPGIVELKYAGGSLFTKSALTFSEPIELKSFSPAKVKAGEVLSIEGDYLNLMHAVVFAIGDTIYEADFKEHTRYLIKVVVPATAQTGAVGISDAAADPNVIMSESSLEVVLPSVAEVLDIKGSKPGDEITIKGNDFDLITKVLMPNDEEVKFTAIDEKISGIKFTLPASISTGYIRVVPASGVEVIVANNGVAEPTDLKATPATELREGDIITISGKNLDIVTNVTFPGVAAAVALEKGGNAEQISVKAPAGFTSGELQLNTGYGVSFPVAIETAKPAFESYNPAPVSAGNEVTITGSNLDLIGKITFTDNLTVSDFAAQSATSITVKVPVTAVTGDVTITMKNGETVAFPSINVDSPVFCFIPELPGSDAEIKAGDLMMVEVVNGDKLTGVQIDGADCQYILNAEKNLYINVPETAGPSSVIKLISSNGEVEYQFAFIPASEQSFLIWTGAVDLDGWSFNWEFGKNVTSQGENAQAFVEIGLKEGDLIRVWATSYNDWWQIQFFDGHWNNQAEIGTATGLGNGNNINSGIYDLAANGGYIAIPVTATLAEQLTTLTDWGYCWIMQGEGIIINKIDVIRKVELGTVLFKGAKGVGCLGNADWTYDAIDGGFDWSQAKPGQKLYIDAHRDEGTADYNNFKVIDSWWAVQIGCFFTEEGIEDNDATTRVESKTFEIELTEDIITTFKDHGGCGVGGHGAVIDKVVLK